MRTLALLPILGISLFLANQEAKAVNVGDAAPCVVLNNIAADGTESEHCIREPKVAGQAKILEFFSATCGACAQNLPIISSLADRLSAKATTRLVGIDRSESLLREYIASHKDLIRFDVALDTNRDAKRAYDVIETPTVFVLDSMDNVIYRHAGVLSESDQLALESAVQGAR